MITLRVVRAALLLVTKGRRYGPGPQLKMIRKRWPDITHPRSGQSVRLSRGELAISIDGQAVGFNSPTAALYALLADCPTPSSRRHPLRRFVF